jgi:hypothetical protein
MKDKELKLEEVKAPHTLVGTSYILSLYINSVIRRSIFVFLFVNFTVILFFCGQNLLRRRCTTNTRKVRLGVLASQEPDQS